MQVGLVVCAAQRFAGGEGDVGDVAIANARWRAVLRHPEAALTLAGLGGGTLVDGAPAGRVDLLHEVAPLVGGGWLLVDQSRVENDGVTLTGRVRSLPDRPAWAEGEERSVTWRVVADDPWLHVEGADGLWIHPSVAAEAIDGWLAHERGVIGHDGWWVEDLGGAMLAWGARRLLLGDPTTAWAERPGPDQAIAGEAPDALRVELFEGDRRVGWVPVSAAGTYAATVPAGVDGLVALGTGRRPSARRSPGPDVLLPLGPGGEVLVRFGWAEEVVARPVRATWTTPEGRSGEALLPPGGGTLPTGPGPVELVLEAAPLHLPWAGRVEVPEDGRVDLDVAPLPWIVSSRHVLADLGWHGARSRTVRDGAADRSRDAVARGLAYVVQVALDDVETGGAYVDDVPWLRWTDGAVLTSRDGWTVSAWPWRADADRAGHGAPRLDGWPPERALRVAWGGAAVRRTTRVDLAWMRAATTPPFAVDPAPDFVALGPPGAPPFQAWAPWFAWLDAGRFVRPSGPLHWVDVGPVGTFGQRDLDLALTTGRFAAGTGAWLDVRIDGRVPGGIVPDDTDDTDDTDDSGRELDTDEGPAPPPGHDVALSLQLGDAVLDRVTVWSAGRGEVRTWSLARPAWSWQGRLELGAWTIVVAWSSTGDDWVVTTPIWTEPPGATTSEAP